MKQIIIAPAILENSEDRFSEQLNSYSKLFTHVDIDLNVEWDYFEGKSTLPIDRVVSLFLKLEKKPHVTFHLMVDYPLPFINFLDAKLQDFDYKIIVHQECITDEILTIMLASKEKFGIAIKEETLLLETVFYKHFSEVQLMTVKIGYQGGDFQQNALQKVDVLRDSGYMGLISIDGGVNLQTIEYIKKHSVDKVSVGSYFSKSSDINSSLIKLQSAL